MPSTTLYLLNKTDGSNAFVIQPQTFDGAGGVQRHTDLTLYGNGAPNWGERFDDNFYHLLENFAVGEKSGTLFIPLDETTQGEGFGINRPIPGQSWYNETRGQLFMYRGPGQGSQGWASATAAVVASSVTTTTLSGLPYTPATGDLVFDQSTSSLKIFNGTAWQNSANGVTSIIAGTGVTISPPSGKGDVTVSISGIGTVTSVAVTGSTGLSVSGSPITSSGTITLTLSSELQGLSTVASTGVITRLGVGSYAARAIVGGTGIVVSNPSGTTGNPTIAVGTVPIANGGTSANSASVAFSNLAPGGSLGSLIIHGSGGYVSLPGGSEGAVLVAAPSSVPGIGAKWVGGAGSFSHSAQGFERLPSGLLLQWGSFVSPSSGNHIVNFPTAFAGNPFSVTNSQPANVSYGYVMTIASVTPTTATFVNNNSGGQTIYWQAIGV